MIIGHIVKLMLNLYVPNSGIAVPRVPIDVCVKIIRHLAI